MTNTEEEQIQNLQPTQTLNLPNNLKLTPKRLKLNLTITPTNPNATQAHHFDEFKLKQALTDFFKTSFLHRRINVVAQDINFKRVRNKKLKRGDPVGHGSLVLRELDGFFSDEVGFVEWRNSVVEKIDGLEVHIEGKDFRLAVSVPYGDDFYGMKKDWEEFYVFRNRGYSRSVPREPDTIILRGMPSRWFAEPRVSSKPSLLVTHTIFSTFGKIRHLDVAEDDDLDDEAEDIEGLIKGLHCKIVVQFEEHKEFYYALKAFCSRSLQKEGSNLKVDYEVSWDRHDFFRNLSNRTQDRSSRMQSTDVQRRIDDARIQRSNSGYSPDNVRRKRFKE